MVTPLPYARQRCCALERLRPNSSPMDQASAALCPLPASLLSDTVSCPQGSAKDVGLHVAEAPRPDFLNLLPMARMGVPGLPGPDLSPDVARWLLDLRDGLSLPPGLRAPAPLPLPLPDKLDLQLFRSSTAEDFSADSYGLAQSARDAKMSGSDDDTADSVSELNSDHSADSLEVDRGHGADLGPPSRPLPPPPSSPPSHDDTLARLSGGECRALPALVEESEEDLSLDEGDEKEKSTTVLEVLETLPPSPSTSSGTWTPWSLSLCAEAAEALESAEALCQALLHDQDPDRTLSQSMSLDEGMVFDDEFLALCSEANRLAEACLRTEPSLGEANVINTEKASLVQPAVKLDINAIFDRGDGGSEPPRPPARKRRRARGQPARAAPEETDNREQRQPEESVRRTDLSQHDMGCSLSGWDAVEAAVTDKDAAWDAGQEPRLPRCQSVEMLLMMRAGRTGHLKRSLSVPVTDASGSEKPGPGLVSGKLGDEPWSASLPELRLEPPRRRPGANEMFNGLADGHVAPCSYCTDGAALLLADVSPCTHCSESSETSVQAVAPGEPVEADFFVCVNLPRRIRKSSVTSDIVAWHKSLFRAGLSEGEDDENIYMESKKWFSSSDDNGRLYFFEENGCESTWNLPDISASNYQDEASHSGDLQVASSGAKDSMGEKIVLSEPNDERHTLRTTKSRSMVIVDSGIKDTKIITSPKNWPQLFDGSMYVLKEGPMYRTKITENGKKLRKNWASCHVVLTELFLLLFRDAKSFAAMKSSVQASTALRPELSVDLNGALIDQVDRGEKASVTSRKNVFLVSTVLGLQVLFQCDSSQQAEEWYNAVHAAIHSLPSGFDSCPRMKLTKEMDRLFGEAPSLDHTKKFSRIGRSKSVKIKNKDGSIEDLTVSVSERQTKIKARLKKFFNRRPTMESLVKKGIWKDEPAFGCYLDQVCGSESPKVPLFVQRCVAVIERNEDNMKTDGLYRASGNLSQVQKIRLQIDQNNLLALEQEDDVHVLTGALKLFFRELKEPLIPYTAFSKAIKASTLQNKKEKLAQFRDIVKSLPSANHDTLKFLLKHLLKVTGYQEFNRMHIPNLAIVFGPTLMWPEQESLNMALDLMQQNLVIEAFLLDFDHIFR